MRTDETSQSFAAAAIGFAIEIGSCAALKLDQAAALARRLLMRRSFYDEPEPDWTHAFCTYVVSAPREGVELQARRRAKSLCDLNEALRAFGLDLGEAPPQALPWGRQADVNRSLGLTVYCWHVRLDQLARESNRHASTVQSCPASCVRLARRDGGD
ncbi:hypothetical protein LPJ38_00420 [Bradyrhizobium daqingense]|uniref:hypothetical protein n=1 Tax=Bradyrhizobium daqingense TaxID=993502 RepID=UPI0011A41500|nr:hypothetical protein [Bradyrhizobium daqingense]UFS89298.1 hypothetical protein LPJ38_00420 [Bradyrhizobium daqingense]